MTSDRASGLGTRIRAVAGAVRTSDLTGLAVVALLVALPLLAAPSAVAMAPETDGSSPGVEHLGGQEADSALSVTVQEAVASGDGTVELVVHVENVGTERSVGPVVQVADVPANWTVAEQTAPNATFRESTNEWLWWGLDPGESATVDATFEVPANATGSQELTVRAHDASEATAETAATVTFDGGTSSGGGLPLLELVVVIGVAAVGVWIWRD